MLTKLLVIFVLLIVAVESVVFVIPLLFNDTQDVTRESRCLFQSERLQVLTPPFNSPCTSSCSSFQSETYYSIKKQLEKMNEIKNSTVVIMTDIPCSQYAEYPDLQELFGDLNRMNQWLKKHQIRMIVSSTSESCTNNKTNNLEFKDFGNDCPLMFATKEEESKQKESRVLVIVIAVVGSLLLLFIIGWVLLCGICFYRRYREEQRNNEAA
ncbi:hypothetical protein M3Y95_01023400 [Aphelenchoides besseyi]|nr:hypothetical protein M3Y95_01023400 [Aphelenchoides besseyi]